MPFTPSTLVPLIQASGFTFWHYRTGDLRAEVGGAAYFQTTAARLRPGDLLLLQAADAMAMLPVRANAATGPGVSLDGAVTPIALTRSLAQSFRLTQTAAAVVRTIVLAPLVAGFLAGSAIPVQAEVRGPIAQVVVSLRDAAGQLVPPARLVTVSEGYASVAIPAPAIGTGYRIRIEDAADPGIVATSRAFSVGPDIRRLLTEEGGLLLQEDGSALRQG
ncbi:MAG: hypothetical protein K2X11_06365 [Acetobacteraceae bacterium]|nr:hypothetical protein [Acetobacteraceae bacterium]